MTHSVPGSWCPFTKVLHALVVCGSELSFLACTAAGVFLGSVSVPFLPIYLQETLTLKEVTLSFSEALPIPSLSPQHWRPGQTHPPPSSLPSYHLPASYLP